MTHIAILGAGRIARTMAKTLRGMQARGDAVCPYAVASRDLDRAQAFAKAEGFERAYGSYEDMLRDDKVDLVYIATPHSHHAEHMRLCIQYGRPVLCEKAFTANAAQAEDIFERAAQKRVFVTEAIWTRYMPSRRIMTELIQSGAIGEPTLLTASLFYPNAHVERIFRPELAGGTLLDIGIYPLNFASMLFDDDFARMDSSVDLMETGVDRQESICLHYPDGRMAQLMAGVTCRDDRRCLVSGTKGYFTVDNVNNPCAVTLFTQEDDYQTGTPIPIPEQITGYEYEVESCLRALQSGALECPEMPHEETVRMMRIMDALRAQWGVRYPFE